MLEMPQECLLVLEGFLESLVDGGVFGAARWRSCQGLLQSTGSC